MSMIHVVVFLISANADAAELHVGAGQTYSSIQGAVNAASNGDVIVVHSGTYAEQVVIDDVSITSLTLKRYSTDSVTIDAPDSNVNAIIANTVDLRIKGITIQAPNHSSPAPRGIQMISEASGAVTHTLTVCDVALEDHQITGSVGINCVLDGNDDVELHGDNVSFSRFATNVGAACSYTGGWDDEPEVCSGW